MQRDGRQRAGQGDGAATCKHGPQSRPRWPTPQTATSHLPWRLESKASGGIVTVRDNYSHSYLQGATTGSPTETRVNVHHIYRGPLHFSQAPRCRGQQHIQEPLSTTPALLPRAPQLPLGPGKPGPKLAACVALTQACMTRSRLGGHGPGHADARSTTQGKGADYFFPRRL